jgi:hypothetical protein
MYKKLYEENLKIKQKKHLENVSNEIEANFQPCLHDGCEYCYGTGIKKDGSPCIHNLSCTCPKCSFKY